LVAAACHYRTVNLPTLVIGPADSVPVLAIGLVTKDFKVSASIRNNSWMVDSREMIRLARHQVSSDKGPVNVTTSLRFRHNG